MRKGVDMTLYRQVVVDNRSGKVESEKLVMRRPPHGVKVLAKRHAANKVAKQARKRNR